MTFFNSGMPARSHYIPAQFLRWSRHFLNDKKSQWEGILGASVAGAGDSNFAGFHVGLALGGGQTSGKLKADYTRKAYVRTEGITTFSYTAFTYNQDASSSNSINKKHVNGALFFQYVNLLTDSILYGVGIGIDFNDYKKSCVVTYTGLSDLLTQTPGVPDDLDPNYPVKGTVNSKITSHYIFEPFLMFGTTFGNDWFLYGKVGLSMLGAKLQVSGTDDADLSFSSSKKKHLWGIVSGIGISYALAQSITMGVEILYRSYSKFKISDIQNEDKNVTFSPRISLSGVMGRFTISYKF